MKIFFLNDRRKTVTVQINGQLKRTPQNPYGMPQIDYHQLAPQEGKTFDVDAPEGAIPYVKVWETGTALLSYVLPQELPSEVPTESSKLKAGEPSDT